MEHKLPIKIQLPEHFLDEEVRCDYTVSTQMKKMWAVEIDLLFEFKRLCDKYRLRWFAAGGTLLGAIRHKGFIPWDDDIDLYMLRADYDVFCEKAKKEVESPYFFTDGTADKGVFRSYAQIYNSQTTCIMANSVGVKRSFNQGISIDIFPFDVMPDSEKDLISWTSEIYKKHHDCCWLYGHVGNYLPKQQEGMKRKCIHIGATLFSHLLWPILKGVYPKRLYAVMQRYQDVSTNHIGVVALMPFISGLYFERTWYRDSVEVPFEWFTLPAPIDYELALTRHYGDWQEFVVGTGLHVIGIMDPEKPYTEYIKK